VNRAVPLRREKEAGLADARSSVRPKINPTACRSMHGPQSELPRMGLQESAFAIRILLLPK